MIEILWEYKEYAIIDKINSLDVQIKPYQIT